MFLDSCGNLRKLVPILQVQKKFFKLSFHSRAIDVMNPVVTLGSLHNYNTLLSRNKNSHNASIFVTRNSTDTRRVTILMTIVFRLYDQSYEVNHQCDHSQMVGICVAGQLLPTALTV
jgi:uncharacterized membrane-anchored protein